MKILGLDGKTYGWEMIHSNRFDRDCSDGHLRARRLLKELFPIDRVWEEVALPGTKPTLYADFILPFRKLLVEVHGKQHYEWIPYFHATKKDFIDAKKRDVKKKEWCELNKILYIELPDTEKEDGWRRRILEFGNENI